jgi:hypothetical protein
MGPVIVVESLGGRFLFLIALGPIAVLFASVFGLACSLLMTCVRAIAWLVTVGQRLGNSANVPRPYLQANRLAHKPLGQQD